MDLERYHPTQFGEARRTMGPTGYIAYFPAPIPRALDVSAQNLMRLVDAEAALGRLSGAGRLLPDPQLLIQPYLRREAVASTRIEGTQASLTDVYEAESDAAPVSDDVEEVLNYVRAMEAGIAGLDRLPLSGRLIRDMHQTILAGVRGRGRQPGEFRTSQNWIGAPGATVETAVFVPPPPEELGALIDDLERFVHSAEQPPLIEAALLHYQFETIHPFLDGNGRLGRLLIVFFLMQRGRLPGPLLFISPYFEARRTLYYDALQGVRERGDFETWLGFFLDAVQTQANDAVRIAEELIDLREAYRDRTRTGRSHVASELADLVFEMPVLTAQMVELRLGTTRPTALAALRALCELGILVEDPAGPRGRLRWRAADVLRVLSQQHP